MRYVISQLANKSKWKNDPSPPLLIAISQWLSLKLSFIATPTLLSHLPLASAAQRRRPEPGDVFWGLQEGAGSPCPTPSSACPVDSAGWSLWWCLGFYWVKIVTVLSCLTFHSSKQSAKPWGKQVQTFKSQVTRVPQSIGLEKGGEMESAAKQMTLCVREITVPKRMSNQAFQAEWAAICPPH